MSERISISCIERPRDIEASPRHLRDIFGRLNISTNANLELISHSAPLISFDELCDLVDNHRLYLEGIMRGYGIPDALKVNTNTALALFDEKVFLATALEIEEKCQNRQTARHENGHKFVAKSLGWYVTEISVEAQGNILGYTMFEPPANITLENYLYQYAAICMGGRVAAELMNDKPDGAGSDMAKVNALAEIAVAQGFSPSVGAFWDKVYGLARSTLAGIGRGAIESESRHLAEIGTKAG